MRLTETQRRGQASRGLIYPVSAHRGLDPRRAIIGPPMRYLGQLFVYVRLTDAEGKYDMRLELVRLDDEQAIGRGEVEANIASRMGAHELTFMINRLVFEKPGRYEFRLFANGRHVGGAPLDVVQSGLEAQHGEG